MSASTDMVIRALREELAQVRILAADQALNLKRVKRQYDETRAELTSANADKEAYAQNAIDLRARIEDVIFKMTFAQSVMLEDERGQRFVALLEQLKGYLK